MKIGVSEYRPLVIGAMGVDISTKELALAAASLGAIGHISDAMITVVTDRHLQTDFVLEKLRQNSRHKDTWDKSGVCFDLASVRSATRLYAEDVMKDKRGGGAVFANCMEKTTMNDGKGTLSARMNGLLDGGIDGITLSAGLHMGSLAMIESHPRFREVKLGIIVSSVRALRIFLLKSKKTRRLPDYIIVEGPLAGGHLGFSMQELHQFTLSDLVAEVSAFLEAEGLDIPIIGAGGVFTGGDAAALMARGAAAVQVATRFTIARESGLPAAVKQAYIKSMKEDIVVRCISPTGYPMRLLRQSPCLGKGVRPNCESHGFLLTDTGCCPYIDAYLREKEKGEAAIAVDDKVCLCTAMSRYQCWTCGASAHRLKETVQQLPSGDYDLPYAEEIIEDYLSNMNEAQAPLPQVGKGSGKCVNFA